MSQDILHLRVTTTAGLAAQVVEPFNLVQEIVDDSDNNGNT